MKRALIATMALCGMLLAGTAAAVPLLGDPINPNVFGWVPNSTNVLNFNKLAPGHIGDDAPYVIFDSHTTGSVALLFNNPAAGLAFFEIRIDGVATGATPHPVVIGDTIHTGGVAVASGVLNDLRNFTASSTVEVRLALGGERDWDFDWVSFAVAEVPEPASMGLALVGLMGVVARRRRRAV